MTGAVPAAVMDLDTTLRFIRSVALARALFESAKLEWKTYDDAVVLNIAYALLPWKEKPGYAEIQTDWGPNLHKRQEQYAIHWVDVWLDRCAQGPPHMHQFLTKLDSIRTFNLQALDELFRDARAINQEVERQLGSAIRTLAVIKLASTIAVAVLTAGVKLGIAAGATGLTLGGASMSFGASAGVFGAVNTGYSITCSLIKEWNSVPRAKVLAVSKEVGKHIGGDVADHTAEKLIQQANASETLHRRMLERAERKIESLTRNAARSARARYLRRVERKIANRQAETLAAQRGLDAAGRTARVGTVLKTGAPIIFAAWDILEAIGGFQEDWAAGR